MAWCHYLNQCWLIISKEHILMEFYLKFKSCHSRNYFWKCCLPNVKMPSYMYVSSTRDTHSILCLPCTDSHWYDCCITISLFKTNLRMTWEIGNHRCYEHTEAWTKWPLFSRWRFQKYFVKTITFIIIFISNCTEVISGGPLEYPFSQQKKFNKASKLSTDSLGHIWFYK